MLISSILASDTGQTPAPDDDFWYTPLGYNDDGSGVAVTPESALRVTAVYACTKVLSETVAMLPLKVYERTSDGGKAVVENHPVHELLHDQPNSVNTSFEFREYIQASVSLRGNGYALIHPGRRGAIDRLELLPAAKVQVEKLPNGRHRYRYTDDGGVVRRFLPDEIFHLRGLGDGLTGLSPIGVQRAAVGRAIATDAYASAFFGNGAKPGGVIEAPHPVSKEIAAKLKEQWQAAYGGAKNSHKTAVLENGMKWHSISMSNEDAQFLETRQFSVREIARIWRVPPHLIGDLEKATFSNIEQQSLEFVMYTMYPWFKRWEQVIQRDLIVDKGRYFAKFNFDALLRGDALSRANVYASGITNGWLTPNEARKREDMNAKPGGDDLMQQLNMTKPAADNATPQTGALLRIMVNDAAQRVANCEARELGKMLAGNKDPEGAAGVVSEFYAQQKKYFNQAFAPVARAFGATGRNPAEVSNLIDCYTEAQCIHFCKAASVQDFIGFLETRAAIALENMILGENNDAA